jgi:hypothetical protein
MANKIILAIDGPSPNVGSGLLPPYGKATDTLDGIETEGTGLGLPAGGIAATSLPTDETVQVIPSTIPVPQVNQEVPGISSGVVAPGGIPTSTVLGVGVAGTGKDQTQQNATTIPAEPSQG